MYVIQKHLSLSISYDFLNAVWMEDSSKHAPHPQFLNRNCTNGMGFLGAQMITLLKMYKIIYEFN